MILPDINLLVYAYNADAPLHQQAGIWWEGLLNEQRPVALPWAVSIGFIRLLTSPRVVDNPLRPQTAIEKVREWLEIPSVQVIEPGGRHIALLEELLGQLGVAGRMTTDAHLAALAIEYQCELHSNDTDFARFAGLRWRNPLKDNGV